MATRTPAMKPLAFRVDASTYSELSQIARDENASVGQLARHLVLSSLRNEANGDASLSRAVTDLFAELDQVREELAALREALVTVFETVLLNTTSAERDEVAKWVAQLRRREP